MSDKRAAGKDSRKARDHKSEDRDAGGSPSNDRAIEIGDDVAL